MSVPTELIARLLELKHDERAELAHVLLTSLDAEESIPSGEWEAAWASEAGRRLQEVDEGRAVLIPREEFEARLRESLARVRANRQSASVPKP